MSATTPSLVPRLADRIIRDNFDVRDGELVVGGLSVRDLVTQFGSPLYIYDYSVLARQFRTLCTAVAGFARVFYSIKANPNPAIARVFVDLGAGLEIASGAEFLLAQAAGCAPSDMLFAGPGKGSAELELTVAEGIGEIHLESFEEVATLAAIAERLQRDVHVAIRVNPGAAAQGGAMRMGGKPAAFGFDEEIIPDVVADLARHPRLKLSGVHLFAGTQILSAGVLMDQWRYGLKLARSLAEVVGQPLRRIDLGGGLGVPYHEGDEPLDLGALRAGARELAAIVAADPLLAPSDIIIEPGRFLAGPAGIYVMTVRSVKTSRGERFLVCDGGMHHHLAASGNLGQVIKRDYPIVAATRLDSGDVASATVVGPLCTPLDTLGRQTRLAHLKPGDLIAVLQSGAYGLSSSPVGFLSHPTPAEVLVRDGSATLIRPSGTFAAPNTGLTLPPT